MRLNKIYTYNVVCMKVLLSCIFKENTISVKTKFPVAELEAVTYRAKYRPKILQKKMGPLQRFAKLLSTFDSQGTAPGETRQQK